MAKSSLVVIDGDPLADATTAYEYAELAEVKFIKLRHKAGAARASHSARGFQGVVVKVRDTREGGRSFSTLWSERDGKSCRAHRPLVFEPEGRTRILTAYLPDSPFNRDKLAGWYFDGACFWTIIEPAILAEVKKAAEAKRDSAPKGPTKDQVIATQADENKVLREKLRLEERLRKEAQEKAEVVTNAQRAIKELPVDRIEAIVEIVHNDNKAVIAKLMEESPKGWTKLKKYRELIQPQIDAMKESELEKMNADHAGVGV